MSKSNAIHYGNVLSDLKAKRKELDKAIASIEALAGMGLFSNRTSLSDYADSATDTDEKLDSRVTNLRRKSSYKAAVELLKLKGATMKTRQIFDELTRHGVIKKGMKPNTFATILYKAKNDGKIRHVGRGEWSFNDGNAHAISQDHTPQPRDDAHAGVEEN